MNARDLMSTEIVFVNPKDNALEIGNRMEAQSIGAVIVAEDGKFCGILSRETFISNISDFCDRKLDTITAADLMEPDVATAKTTDEMPEIVELLIYQKSFIERLPITEDGKVVGLISLGGLAKVFTDSMGGEYKVSDLMHYNPATVEDYAPLTEVIDVMKNMGVKRVLVLSGDTLVGIISVKDLSLNLFHHMKESDCEGAKCELTAESVMSRDPITISKNVDAVEAAKIMLEKDIGGIPIVDTRVEGMISRKDLLKAYQLQFSQK